MKLVLSQSAYVLLASSSLTIAAWRLMQWRARKRAKIAADRVQGMVKPGPLIDTENKAVCENVVNAAIRRASKWISFQLSAEDGTVMIGQVGGVSAHKRPVLTLEPDYVMKPVQRDHRGMREIFLYEAVKVLSKNRNSHPYYASLLTGTNHKKPQYTQQQQQQSQQPAHMQQLPQSPQQASNLQLIQASGLTELWDTLAMWLAMKMNDPFVTENEKLINKSWKALRKEVEVLRRLATFIPPYYGVVGQRSPMTLPKGEIQAHKAMNNHHHSKMNGNAATHNANPLNAAAAASHYGMSLEAHLLLTDVTANFRKPCVMDIKMGTHSYEPDAPEDKRLREMAKYPQQEIFGFRIVGMRFYEPDHPEADENGFRFFQKEYGRGLATLEDLAAAMRLFLSAGCDNETAASGESDHTVSRPSTTPQSRESVSKPASPNNGGGGGGSQGMMMEQRLRIRALTGLLAQLRPIMGFFDENKTLCFYSSSLLLVYEGDKTAPSKDVTDIKMIDFGRVRRQPGGDHGYRTGLRTLKTLMDKVRKEEKQRLESVAVGNGS